MTRNAALQILITENKPWLCLYDRKREEKKKDFVADNRRDVGQRLTQEQEELVARLLEDWEGNTVQDGNTPGPQGIWEEISRYELKQELCIVVTWPQLIWPRVWGNI